MGTTAKQDWEAEKQRNEIRGSGSPGPQQQEKPVGVHHQRRRGLVRTADQFPLPAITREEQEASRIRRPRQSKKPVIPSSSSPPEIPETQQEISSDRGSVVVEVFRPAGFDSQDWSTAASSQLASVVAIQNTQNTGSSKDTVEGDSTLGSSLPPDSPSQVAVDSSAPQIEESSSQVLQPSFQSDLAVPHNSTARALAYEHSIFPDSDSQANHPNLLVVRTDSPENPNTGRPLPAEVQAEHTSFSPASSPLFVPDGDDLDLQPIVEPSRSRAESPTEGKFEFLPAVSPLVRPSIQNSVQPNHTNSEPESAATSARLEKSQSQTISNTGNLKGRDSEPEQEKAQQLFSTPVRNPAPSNSKALTIHTSTRSGRFHTQASPPEAPDRQAQSLSSNSRLKAPRKSVPTSSRHSRAFAAQSQPRPVLRSASSAPFTSRSLSPLLHPTSPFQSVSPSASLLSTIEHDMPSSHGESSPRIGRPPSALSEDAPELGLREKLRQIRATARSNHDARSRRQSNTGHAKSPATKTLETRFSRRLSPENDVESVAIASAPVQDRPIPSLENVGGPAGEMDVEKADNEPTLCSSLAPQPAILDAALDKSMMPTKVNDIDKSIPELDVSTMPLLQPAEFLVPLPIDGRIKHQYIAELNERYNDIADFLSSPRSPRLIDAMNEMIRQLNDIVIHTDLGLNGPATQIASSPQEALWAEDASSKFAFLGEFIRILRGSNQHIVLTAGSGPTLDLLHNYLKGKGVRCRRYLEDGTVSGLQTSHQADQTMYTLISTNHKSLQDLPRSSSLIIAFDNSLDTAMLPEWCSMHRFVPVLLLLVVNSAEHVGRCVPKDVPEPERLRRLVKATVHVHKELGEMDFQRDLHEIYNLDQGGRLAFVKKDLGAKITHAAMKTAESLLSNNFAPNFTLRPISELDLRGLEDYPPSTGDSKGVSSSASRAGTPSGQKRFRVSMANA